VKWRIVQRDPNTFTVHRKHWWGGWQTEGEYDPFLDCKAPHLFNTEEEAFLYVQNQGRGIGNTYPRVVKEVET
jgi:hypothetical protein